MKKNAFIFAAIFAASLSFTSCLTTTTNAGSVGADRKQILLVSEEEIEQSAQQSYAEVLQEAQKAGSLNKDAATVQRVQKIADNLIEQTGVFRSDAPGWNWQVNVISDKTVNAWCMPGGKIVVYTGIINGLKLTDGELRTSGGRVLAVTSFGESKEKCAKAVYDVLSKISYDGMHYRKDIAKH